MAYSLFSTWFTFARYESVEGSKWYFVAAPRSRSTLPFNLHRMLFEDREVNRRSAKVETIGSTVTSAITGEWRKSKPQMTSANKNSINWFTLHWLKSQCTKQSPLSNFTIQAEYKSRYWISMSIKMCAIKIPRNKSHSERHKQKLYTCFRPIRFHVAFGCRCVINVWEDDTSLKRFAMMLSLFMSHLTLFRKLTFLAVKIGKFRRSQI